MVRGNDIPDCAEDRMVGVCKHGEQKSTSVYWCQGNTLNLSDSSILLITKIERLGRLLSFRTELQNILTQGFKIHIFLKKKTKVLLWEQA